MAANQQDFDEILINAIDDALLSLGTSARQSIYFHLKNNFNVDKEMIPQKLEVFQEGLEKIFGIGARFLEILIMKNLYTRLGRTLNMQKNDSLEFVKYVAAAKQNFIKDVQMSN